MKSLFVFAAVLPIANNTISLLQIMFLAIGKAKQIAIRNLIVSVLKFAIIVVACKIFNSVSLIFLFQLIADVFQVCYFVISLKMNNCRINIFKFDISLIREILKYCIPMAMFTIIKSLNRDADKYIISFFTSTETLAIYTNASKILPFDIIMTSFCTVLLPYVTRYIANLKYERCRILYKSFLELSHITTTILAVGAVCVAPELMSFLYTNKYTSASFSVPVFVMYILVDVVSVLNITLILSAAGKTKSILFTSIGSLILNIVLSIFLFFAFMEIGPALATLLVTIVQGVVLLSLGSRVLKTNLIKMYDWKYLSIFLVQLAAVMFLAYVLRNVLIYAQVHYLIILFVVYFVFVSLMLIFNLRRLTQNLRIINSCKSPLP